MLTVDEIAYYIIREYKAKYHHSIDLKKIGKLLYFAQRESYIVRDMPLFEEEIYAVKSGPTALYSECHKFEIDCNTLDFDKYSVILDKILEVYAVKSELSLTNLSFGEISWRNAYNKMMQQSISSIRIEKCDIQLDAHKIKKRRKKKF